MSSGGLAILPFPGIFEKYGQFPGKHLWIIAAHNESFSSPSIGSMISFFIFEKSLFK